MEKEKTINKNKQHTLELVSELSFVFFIFSVIPLWGISLTCHYVSRSAQAANIDEVGHLPRVAVAKFITRLPLSHADPSHTPTPLTCQKSQTPVTRRNGRRIYLRAKTPDDSRSAKVVNSHDGTPQTVKIEGFDFKAAMIGRFLYGEATAAVAEKIVRRGEVGVK